MADNIVGAVRPNWFMRAIEAGCLRGNATAITDGVRSAMECPEVKTAIEKTLLVPNPPIGPQLSRRIAEAIAEVILAEDEPMDPEIWDDA